MLLKELNELNLGALTISEMAYVIKQYNCYAVCHDGKVLRLEPNTAEDTHYA